MKKRRPCIDSHSYLSENSRRPLRNKTLFTKSKSQHELKRRGEGKITKQKSCNQKNNIYLKNDVFDNLETLFDLKKPLTLPEIHSSSLTEKFIDFTFDSSSSTNSCHNYSLFLNNCISTSKLEPNIITQPNHLDALSLNESVKETNIHEEILENEEIYSLKSYESNENSFVVNLDFAKKMANEGKLSEQELDDELETSSKKDVNSVEKFSDVITLQKHDSEALPPPHPLPQNIGEGIPVKSGHDRDSIMSAIPFTDSAVLQDMNGAYENCITIEEEIEQLKKEINELINKSDLSQEDTILLSEKQENISTKLAQLDEMTRKVQRIIGLSDPSSYEFAKMFEMLPYPHKKEHGDEKLDEEYYGKTNDLLEDDDRFDVPKIEYPEDKLPRVIICGNTEDCIPKIVVADSQCKRSETTHLESLTGKLSESLIMQEKLVKENAKLEGGKYKLEEAILEKDNAVDNLQRKVCGLQAEMRIIVKENTELSRQLACLNEKIATPSCCYTCPGGSSSSPFLPAHSYNSINNLDDSVCRCRSCLEEHVGDSLALMSGTQRLSGGGAEENTSILENNTLRGNNMACFSPTGTKTSTSPRPLSKGMCPAELNNAYEKNTKNLEEQLGNIESEVRTMQMELINVQRERNQLDQQRKLFKCTAPCAPCSCNPTAAEPVSRNFQPCPPCVASLQSGVMPTKMNISQDVNQGCGLNNITSGSQCNQPQLRDLKEQYARLQDDYKSKLCEVSCLRTDAEKMKQETRDIKEEKAKIENKLIDLQERLKVLEIEKNKMSGNKEQLIEQEQALLVAKQRFRDAQDELEELRSLTHDQSAQLEDYRNKYLMAQQKVEEQRHQLDLMELDNVRMNENVTLEIGRVKNQFQEKLAELAPLPDILKQTQLKLQESQQLRQISERHCEDYSREILDYKDKIETLQKEMEILRSENNNLQEECSQQSEKCDELEKENSELRTENDRLKNTLIRFEEQETQFRKCNDEKLHEVAQLTSLLEQVREDSARQVARTKERSEMMRKTMQNQISEMERQLAQCRATAKAAQKDRDEIRQKMQGQINNLNESFKHAQGRIKSLQGHVNYLKTSYSNIFSSQGQGEAPVNFVPGESPTTAAAASQGYDTCDCNY